MPKRFSPPWARARARLGMMRGVYLQLVAQLLLRLEARVAAADERVAIEGGVEPGQGQGQD
eukprot:scaffold43253_cov43-Phaeocystis_antarctica.AAC.2